MDEAHAQLRAFVEKYNPEIQQFGCDVLERVRKIVPPCVEMVYDNYNGLVVGFSPDDKPSNAVFSVLFMPKWITLCFLQGAGLPDPTGLLRGGGNLVRHMRLSSPADLDQADVLNLMEIAMARAKKRFPEDAQRTLVVKSISAKQRPRRP